MRLNQIILRAVVNCALMFSHKVRLYHHFRGCRFRSLDLTLFR
nr:MAG TPA: hypothetical protein [Bacteriophage sp.]